MEKLQTTYMLPSVSVVIPTYNRTESLLRTLESLARQSYSAEHLEVVVVDDGGSDSAECIMHRAFPFALHYLRQENQGATAARNNGAAHSRGDLLVFVDDDVRLHPWTLARLLAELGDQKTIVLGTLITPPKILNASLFARSHQMRLPTPTDDTRWTTVPPQECMTGLLAINRSDFFGLGMFHDPTGGWPNWDDVDFGYRASEAGFRFVRCASATAEHWDYAATDLQIACQRWYRASRSAPRLFQRHPALKLRIPMFYDKGPIAWRADRPALIGRKLARQIVSSPPVLCGMQTLVRTLEAHYPSISILEPLYRWISSAYIYKGYRQGLQELAAEKSGASFGHFPGLDLLSGAQGAERAETRDLGGNATR